VVLVELLEHEVAEEAVERVAVLQLMEWLMAVVAVQVLHQKAELLVALAQLELSGPEQQGNFHQLIQEIYDVDQ
jgi:hypothetical protein